MENRGRTEGRKENWVNMGEEEKGDGEGVMRQKNRRGCVEGEDQRQE